MSNSVSKKITTEILIERINLNQHDMPFLR